MDYKKLLISFLAIIIFLKLDLSAQIQRPINSAELISAVEKLNVVGSVLYIAAHPDDENTSVLAYLSKGRKFRTGYIALTRGDGGQNLIGSEKGAEIGIIRTKELLAARKIDGAEQYFTRAIDFGYSKSPEETFNFWGKENILSDVVWVIRNFKPDVIITRFPSDGRGGHGHHTASAILAKEAFYDAADSNKFKEQLKYVDPWQAKRLFWNAWRPSEQQKKSLIKIDVGNYNPVLGKSYTEIAADSRSMHKSQGFGASERRGNMYEYFELTAGDKPNKDLFDDIDITWNRVKNSKNIQVQINKIISSFNPKNPSESVENLINLNNLFNSVKDNYWVKEKKKELIPIIQSCTGFWLEAIADDYSSSPGDKVSFTTTLINRSNLNLTLDKISISDQLVDSTLNLKLENNNPIEVTANFVLPKNFPISQPYWLKESNNGKIFNVDNQEIIGNAENPPSVDVWATVKIGDNTLRFQTPLIYKWTDRVKGEQYRSFEIRPPVVTSIQNKLAIFTNDNSKVVKVRLKSNTNEVSGILKLNGNSNWQVSPEEISFSFDKKYAEKSFTFTITPPKIKNVANLSACILIDGKTYNKDMVEIYYDHIGYNTYFPDSKIKLVKLDINKFDGTIGYIMGAGDDVPEALENLGYKVIMLSDENLENENLNNFDAIITGIRAYNTRERLKYDQPKLINYVKNGGTLIVQYNVSYGLQTKNIGPYPFSLNHGRVTDENAEMKFLDPTSKLLNFPNRITNEDFENWVQERGLYFSDNWDNHYTTVFASHDEGENDLKGSLLYTKYGKGVFIYTGISFFRQLPAGVPGAFRLFVNLISAGK